MALLLDALVGILHKPTVWGMVSELALFAAPLWVAVLVGLVAGWAWRPRWAAELVRDGDKAALDSPSSFGLDDERKEKSPESDILAVNSKDLDHLCKLVEERDGGLAWHRMMEKSLPNMSYHAWRRDPERGPPQYRSRTVFEDATPEIVRDFFWDDEFRIKNKWDDMLLCHRTLEECPTTGTMVVQWIRKFPFFCSDREYIIGRRIWEMGRTYYSVTKGVAYPSVPRCDKPRRVDLYYSSWCIRAVESIRGDGQLTACEVLLFHHEDMGIPWEIAKLGVRQGMWGMVKKVEPGLRAYQAARKSGKPLSRCAFMAQINTKVNPNYLISLESSTGSTEIIEREKEKNWGNNIPKILAISGAVALALMLDRGLLTKAVIFGTARRFGNLGRRL